MPGEIVRKKIDNVYHYFITKMVNLCIKEKCVQRKAISTVMQLAHDARTAGHFGYFKTLSRLRNYHRKHKSRDVKNYVQGCLICQKKENHWGKELTEPTSSEVPEDDGVPLQVTSLRSFQRQQMDSTVSLHM